MELSLSYQIKNRLEAKNESTASDGTKSSLPNNLYLKIQGLLLLIVHQSSDFSISDSTHL
jgi:hypothetical protein